MFSRSDAPTEVPASTAERRGISREWPGRSGRSTGDQGSGRALSALAYAARCHAGQQRESDGAPFIEHLSEVARLLRDAGCTDVVVAAGLLHSVVQDTDVSAAELTARFGADVSSLVQTATDDSVGSYAQRKDALRQRSRDASPDARSLFAANGIAEVRELADEARRARIRVAAEARSDRSGSGRRERYQQMRLREHRADLAMLLDVAPGHRLVRQLVDELDTCVVCVRLANRASAGQ